MTTVTNNSPTQINVALNSLKNELESRIDDIENKSNEQPTENKDSGVTSVNGKSGTVVLNYQDVKALPDTTTHLSGDVPITRKVNNKELSSDITLTASDVSALPDTTTHLSGDVPITRKVNNKALSSDITLTASDVGALSDTTTHLSGDVPTTRKVNNKALSSDITLTASDVGARADSAPISGNWFRGTPVISSAGIMDIGQVIDFHIYNAGTGDYNLRLTAGTAEGSRIIGFPTGSGTLCLGSSVLYDAKETVTISPSNANISIVGFTTSSNTRMKFSFNLPKRTQTSFNRVSSIKLNIRNANGGYVYLPGGTNAYVNGGVEYVTRIVNASIYGNNILCLELSAPSGQTWQNINNNAAVVIELNSLTFILN